MKTVPPVGEILKGRFSPLQLCPHKLQRFTATPKPEPTCHPNSHASSHKCGGIEREGHGRGPTWWVELLFRRKRSFDLDGSVINGDCFWFNGLETSNFVEFRCIILSWKDKLNDLSSI